MPQTPRLRVIHFFSDWNHAVDTGVQSETFTRAYSVHSGSPLPKHANEGLVSISKMDNENKVPQPLQEPLEAMTSVMIARKHAVTFGTSTSELWYPR